MKISVSDSIANMSEKVKKLKAEPGEGGTDNSTDNATDTSSRLDRLVDEKSEG